MPSSERGTFDAVQRTRQALKEWREARMLAYYLVVAPLLSTETYVGWAEGPLGAGWSGLVPRILSRSA